ncbi:MAG: hypothetical protein M3Y77_07605 [Actinomycetota bacterium]|nr:hypothetical protein [Actinomycetota bacterium]
MALRSAASDALIAPSGGVELTGLLGGREVPDVAEVADVAVDERAPLLVVRLLAVGLLADGLLVPTEVLVFEVVTDELTVEGATDGPELSDGPEGVDPSDEGLAIVEGVMTCSLGSIDTRLVSDVGPLEVLLVQPASARAPATSNAALRLALDLITPPTTPFVRSVFPNWPTSTESCPQWVMVTAHRRHPPTPFDSLLGPEATC